MEISIFKRKSLAQATRRAMAFPAKSLTVAVLASALYCTPAFAVQTGGIKGTISSSDGSVDGITVTATSNVMPKARTVSSNANGSYNLPLLIPGTYTLTFTAADGSVETTSVEVLLDLTSKVNVLMDPSDNNPDNILTIMGSGLVIREGDSSLTNSISAKEIENLPVGEEYRDILKLIPGVQYSEYTTLGPSAGGSGRDNKYGFDGVDISLPMFGNLASEPSTHDIQNVSIDRGGAKAIGFNRSGGFAINTTSKSGTNEFHGDLQYKLQNKNFVSDKDNTTGSTSELDKSWLTASLGGPIIEDELFFYGSYYRPETNRVNKETAYGSVKDFESIREEYFGKLTYAPTEDLLINLSLRSSDNEGSGQSVGSKSTDSTSESSNSFQDIYTFEASYIISDYTTFTIQYNEFELKSQGSADTLFPNITPALGGSLNISMLDQLGLFSVPNLDSNAEYDNVIAQMLIDQYGYIDPDTGLPTGGGSVGGAPTISDSIFTRDNFELALDHEMDVGSTVHFLHFGFKMAEATEILHRVSNGWGSISYRGGETDTINGVDLNPYYRARVYQMSLTNASGDDIPDLVSTTESFNFEINDTIEDGNFTYNLGLLISKDVLYGQGLKPNSSNPSGFELAFGNKYEMHSSDWADMIQPRLGVTWAYNGEDTLFANFASYNPEASSLSRAASWDRRIADRTLNVYFDENGDFLDSEPAAGSSGKLFQEGITPRRVDELTFGTTKQVTDQLFIRAHIRRREGSHFWEDVENGSRLWDNYGPEGHVPEHIAARGLYIPDLNSMTEIAGFSDRSYVIAELDDTYTSYNEFSVEAEWQGDRTYLKASYVWSHYYGNFDQDGISGNNDRNLFIGSSSAGDGKGRMPWDNKKGDLLGDKPHIFKAYGYYTTDWNANIGAYLLYQSGDVWEKWDGDPYGYSSDFLRFGEPAGSRRSPSHWQLDLNYTQDFDIADGYTLAFRADLFNVFDNQTGYRYDPYNGSSTFGEPRSLINPRRFQLSVNVGF